jgi:hypothetical protein
MLIKLAREERPICMLAQLPKSAIDARAELVVFGALC